MMVPDPTLAITLALAAHVFLYAGVHKGVLSLRRPQRRCPACRRLEGSCGCASQRSRHLL
jgi:hypothetical protein